MAVGGLIGRKLGMTQVYTPGGVLVPVTVIQAGPCTVVAARRGKGSGPSSVQLGYGASSRDLRQLNGGQDRLVAGQDRIATAQEAFGAGQQEQTGLLRQLVDSFRDRVRG